MDASQLHDLISGRFVNWSRRRDYINNGRTDLSRRRVAARKALAKLISIQLRTLAIAIVMAIRPISGNAEEAIGDKFRKAIAEIDAHCKRDKRGPYLDRGDPEYRNKARDTSCDILKLEPRDWRQVKTTRLESQAYPVPEHWLSTAESRFAHSIELPDAKTRPANIYKPGMTGKEYFERLCEQGYGEFIYRTVPSVLGVREDRAWIPMPGAYSDLAFWTREKGGLYDAPDYLVQPPLGGYQYLEIRLSESDAKKSGAPFRVFYHDDKSTRNINARAKDGTFIRIPYVVAQTVRKKSEARHGFTWRGIWPPHGIQNGIEGFELIAYTTAPFEIVGYQRQYFRHLPNDRQPDSRLTRTVACEGRSMMPVHEFLQRVLVPASR